jgi:hypothetical protein
VAQLVARDGDRCWYCGYALTEGDRACTIDHVLPRSEGGSNRLENLRLACSYCNGRRARFPEGVYEKSEALATRRRLAYRDAMLATGCWLPKRAFHHPAIQWHGDSQWSCDACGNDSERSLRSPAAVPCAPWCEQGDAEWTQWWRERIEPPSHWPHDPGTCIEPA